MTAKPSRLERDAELEDLRGRLAETEDVLNAIRNGDVDAVVVTGEHGEHVYTLHGAYRQLTETMSEGVVTLSAEGVILYCNVRLAEMLGRPLDQVLGSALRDHLPSTDQPALASILAQARTETIRREINLKASDGRVVPIYLSASHLQNEGAEMVFCLVLTDLSEQKLHEQIECLARFPSENPNPVLRVSVQGIVQYANIAANVILPAMGAEIGGGVNAEWQAHIDDVVAKAHPVDIEFQAGDRTVFVALTPVIKHGYVNLYGRDITDHKRAAESLQQSEERYRRLFEESLDGICLVDAQTGTILDCNLALLNLVGRKKHEVVGQSVQILHPPSEVAGAVTSSFEQHRQEKAGQVLEVPIITKTGEVRTAEIMATVREVQGRKTMVGIFRDITDRRRSEEALRGKGRLLSESQRLGHIGSWLWRGTGPISWSDEMYRLYGVSPDTFTPTPESLISLLHPDDRPAMQAWIEACAAGEQPGELEYRVNLPDGTIRYLQGRGEAVQDAQNRLTHMAGTVQDVTARRQAELEHEKLQSQLVQAQKMESVGRLAGGVAHDFNNLLMGVMGYTQLCRDKIEPNHPIREWLDEITRETERSANLTHQLLAFARKQIIAPKVLNLNDAIESMLKLLRRLIGEDIKVRWTPTSGAWPVKMDPAQIDQILANLVVNARDAIGGVGLISIETGNATLDQSYCYEHTGSEPGDYVLLTVSDTGCGMDRETLGHIFEPFFTTKGVGEGTGLGLATVYGIVKQNNGFVNVYSEPGNGTTFKIYLPRFVSKEAAQVAAETPTEPPRGTETILLVEDEKSVRVTTAAFLEGLGYMLLVAEAPEQALRLVAEHPGEIHLLITDVIMPGMSGRDLSNRLLELRPTIKRLFISGFTADVIAQRGILEDGVNFLSKPFGRDVLAHKVREVLDA